MKVYITFGQCHAHATPKGAVDKDTVAVINCEDYADGRAKAFEMFDAKWHMCYSEGKWDDDKLMYFPKGLLEVN